MRPATVAACLATIAVVVPAGWHVLDADLRADGPAVRPARQVLEIGDTTVTLEVDRGVMPSGGTMSVTLVATGDAREVALDLTAMEDNGIGGERVPNPPTIVERRVVKLHADPGGGPPVVASFQLGKKRGTGRLQWFDVVATPFARQKITDRPEVGGDSAVVGLATWNGNTFPIAIEPPAKMPAEGPFTVAVRVKNTTGKPLQYLYNQLGGGTVDGYNVMGGGIQIASDEYDVTEAEQPELQKPEADAEAPFDDNDPDQLKPGAERLYIYTVTPRHPGVTHFTFIAHANARTGGAFETLQLDRPAVVEPGPPALAVK
jgi:hypothetical protein